MTPFITNGSFSEIYPVINNELINTGEKVPSRNGDTIEYLNSVVEFNPLYSCTGGYKRNMNIFFLLAEALWIWIGRRDLKFLEIFNKRMRDFSDDGKTFHAPYGWRLRHWGEASEAWDSDERIHSKLSERGMDQIAFSIQKMIEDPGSRQIVLGIWNPNLDGNFNSTKDRPCNDMLMYKIREGGLYAIICNRSNDLHWGLPTNVFQFSFIGKVIANILGLKYVSQLHLSQSLHFYEDNPIAKSLQFQVEKERFPLSSNKKDLYDYCDPFSFGELNANNPMVSMDFCVHNIIERLLSYESDRSWGIDDPSQFPFNQSLIDFSRELFQIYKLLSWYIFYKKQYSKKSLTVGERRLEVLEMITKAYVWGELPENDLAVLAMNFFVARLTEMELVKFCKIFSDHIKDVEASPISATMRLDRKLALYLYFSQGYYF